MCDPYQPLEKETLATRKTIEMLHEAGMNVCVLTKSPTLAYRDIDLYEPGDAFATTLTFTPEQDKESLEWEPLAELPHQRIMGLKAFREMGIPTWVSLEPVIDPKSTLELIKMTHRIVGHYKVGKLNYVKSDIDWTEFVRKVKSLLDSVGGDYYIKEDLKKYES
jgi:DNA repair photolyase